MLMFDLAFDSHPPSPFRSPAERDVGGILNRNRNNFYIGHFIGLRRAEPPLLFVYFQLFLFRERTVTLGEIHWI